MNTGKWSLGLVCLAALALVSCAPAAGNEPVVPGEVALTARERLGEFLYFDENLSQPAGQSCASCHDPDAGFADPDDDLPVSEGAIAGLFGTRNTPSSAYAMYSPPLHWDEAAGLWIGGQFWDGRATGEALGDPLADQAGEPFLNPVEMANASKEQVVADVAASEYVDLFEEVWDAGSLDDVEAAYDQILLSIAAFERTARFGSFSSKYDAYLKACLEAGGEMNDCAQGVGPAAQEASGKVFHRREWHGMQFFMGANDNDGVLEAGEGGGCVACHLATWTPDPGNVAVPDWAPEGWVPPLFTDLSYDNLGLPRNTEHPFDPDAPADLGLGAAIGAQEENGKFRVMSLRNVDLTAPYGHNGLFKSLQDVTHFYNTRDVPGALGGGESWPPPEYADTVNVEEMGNLGLRPMQEEMIVVFMRTLSDGYRR